MNKFPNPEELMLAFSLISGLILLFFQILRSGSKEELDF